jgi:hypothetical protein
MNAYPDSPLPEQIVFLLPGTLIETAGFAVPILTLPRRLYSLPRCSTPGSRQSTSKSTEAEALSAPERPRGDTMEQQCSYCEQPLAETEKVRWYGEYVHSECYEVLLAEAVAIIITEPPAQDHGNEQTAGFA